MKLRSQLVLAFLLLAVIPLAAIVLYSYATSLAAVKKAVVEDSEALADDMDRHLEEVKSEIAAQVAGLGELPLGALAAGTDGEQRRRLLEGLESRFGEVEPYIEALEFVPAPPRIDVEGGHPVPHPPVPPEPAHPRPPPVPAPPGEAEAARIETGSGVLVIVPPPEGADGRREDGGWQIRWDWPEDGAPGKTSDPEAERKKEMGLKVAGVALTVADELMKMGVAHMEQEVEAEKEKIAAEAETVEAEAAAARAEIDKVRAELAALESKRDVVKAIRAAVNVGKDLTESERAELEANRRKSRMLFGRSFELPIEESGELVGKLTAEVRADEVLRRVLARTDRSSGEIPFAVDAEGALHVADEGDREQLETLDVTNGNGDDREVQIFQGENDWVTVTRKDPDTGLRFGISRPIAANLRQIRTTAARNFGYGLAMVGIAMVGILPLASRMTRHLQEVTDSADAIARGDLSTRVPVPRSHELGRLAMAFNTMAKEISESQKRLVEEERIRREREMQQKLLEADHARKSQELEEARRFQLSLLPKSLPQSSRWEVAVLMRTATEVGGDYYDFQSGEDGSLVVAIGDATGHGAAAGTMVTIVKSLFSTLGNGYELTEFLDRATLAIKRMELPRMAMALTLARIEEGAIRVAPAGMPPALVHRRATGHVEEMPTEGMPLGGVVGFAYREALLPLEPGDTILLMSDGFPELHDPKGEPVGYARARDLFAKAAAGDPKEIVAALAREADRWAAGRPPQDDITFVVVRVRDTRAA